MEAHSSYHYEEVWWSGHWHQCTSHKPVPKMWRYACHPCPNNCVISMWNCATASYLCGKEKTTAVSVLNKYNLWLCSFGEPIATFEEIRQAGTKFFCYLYGCRIVTSLNSLHHTIFSGNDRTTPIKTLPLTDESALQQFLRPHLTVMLWKAGDQQQPLDVDVT